MRLAEFILQNMERILVEWEAFAGTLLPAAQSMTPLALRNHAQDILEAVAKDISTPQTCEEQGIVQGPGPEVPDAPETAAQTHAVLRARSGFDITQLVAEYRALRASVLRLWIDASPLDQPGVEEVIHASEYPDNLNVAYEYPDGRLLIYENYPFTAYGLHGFDNGNVFYGTEGHMIFSRRGAFRVFLGPRNRPGPTEGKDLRGERGYAEHMADFPNAVRTRNPETAARPELAHLSCALVHLGEIAFRTKGRLDFDPRTERFIDCDEANQQLTKEYRSPYGLPASI